MAQGAAHARAGEAPEQGGLLHLHLCRLLRLKWLAGRGRHVAGAAAAGARPHSVDKQQQAPPHLAARRQVNPLAARQGAQVPLQPRASLPLPPLPSRMFCRAVSTRK